MLEVLLWLACLGASQVWAAECPIWNQMSVPTGELGQIVGAEVVTSKKQDRYYTFTGIPYADPASYTGDKRFEPSSIWTGPLNPASPSDPWFADKVGKMCPQREILDLDPTDALDLLKVLNATSYGRREAHRRLREARKAGTKADFPPHWGTEDCLNLNINVPADVLENPPAEKLPVIVYFHGGGGDSVFGSVFMGLRLMERRVILVTLNYRLGILGAFNMGVDGAPGCAAPYDGVTALQWIQKYISHFGGDPAKVTIAGQSAGANMVTQLLLTPLTKDKGYFSGVIGFSGSALSVWATTKEPSLPHHLRVAELTGCYDGTSVPDTEAIVQCMKAAPLQDLVDALDVYEEEEMFQGRLGFDARMPSIQSDSLTIERFLPKDPMEVLRNGEQTSVALMLGATKHDGSYPLDDIYTYYLEPNDKLDDENYMKNEMLPELLTMLGLEDPSRAMYHSFQKEYLGDTAQSTEFDPKMPGLIDMSTVFGFKAGQYRFIEEHSRVNPNSYFYSFDYTGRWTLYEVLQGFNKKIPGGIAHTDEQMYLFYMGPMLNEDSRVSERMLDYVVNFAYHGNPNGEIEAGSENWERHDTMSHPYFEINKIDQTKHNARNSWIDASLELFDEDGPIRTPPVGIRGKHAEDGVNKFGYKYRLAECVIQTPGPAETTTEGGGPAETTTEGGGPVETTTEGGGPTETTTEGSGPAETTTDGGGASGESTIGSASTGPPTGAPALSTTDGEAPGETTDGAHQIALFGGAYFLLILPTVALTLFMEL